MTQLNVVQVTVRQDGVLKWLDDDTIKELQKQLNKISNVKFKESKPNKTIKRNLTRIDSHRLPI